VFAKRKLLLLITAAVFLLLPKSVLAADFGDVVINEVYYHGSSSREWVELYNFGEVAIDLNQCYLQDNTGKDNLSGLIINSKEFVVIASESIDDQLISNWGKNIFYIQGAIGNGLAQNDQLALICFENSKENRVDGVSWGSDNSFTILSSVAEGHSLERVPAGTGSFVEQEEPTPGTGIFSLPTPTSIPTPTLTNAPTPTLTLIPTSTPTPTPTKATYQINEVKNEDGDILSSVKDAVLATIQ